jgi:hypothetical protein
VRFKRYSDSPLKKKTRRGFRGYRIATIAFYGPDDKRPSKVAVAIVNAEGAEPGALQRWFAEEGDVRADPAIASEILHFVRDHGAKSVVTTDRIIGCPEGVQRPRSLPFAGFSLSEQICPRGSNLREFDFFQLVIANPRVPALLHQRAAKGNVL